MVLKSSGNAGGPLYAVSFTVDDMVVAGGGGGQGAHGVKNKLVVFKQSGNALIQSSEYIFPDNSDSPTSLAANSDGTVWVGANAPAETKDNKHMQKFIVSEDGSIQWRHALNAFKSTKAETYQRATAVAGTAVAAASSDVPGTVSIVAGESATATMDFNFEILDMTLSDYDAAEQKYVLAVGEQVLEFRNVNSPSDIWARVKSEEGHKWTRAMFTRPDTAVVASTIGNRKGVQLTRFTVDKSGVRAMRTVRVPRILGVTAMAAGGDKLAVAAPSGDIVIYDSSSDLLTKSAILKGVHGFPVTAVSVSSDGASVASVSLDGSIVVHSGMARRKAPFAATLVWVILSALFIAIIAVFSSYYAMNHASQALGGSITDQRQVVELPFQATAEMGHGPIVQDFLTPKISQIVAVDADATGEHEGGHLESLRDSASEAEPKALNVALHKASGSGHGPVSHLTEHGTVLASSETTDDSP